MPLMGWLISRLDMTRKKIPELKNMTTEISKTKK